MEIMEKKTVKELREIAKELCIVGRWDMKKNELIEAINKVNQDFDDRNISFETDCIIKSEEVIKPEGSQNVTATTEDYVNNIKEGTLVAFKRDMSKDIAMSGKFIGYEEKTKKVIIESKRGTKYRIQKENIIWVKTGSRWPRWVYSLFNNKEVNNEQK